MKYSLVLALLIALMSNACMDVSVLATVNAKGAGELKVELEILDQMYQVLGSGGGADMNLTLFDEKALRAILDERGGKVRRYANKLEQGIRNIEIFATFPDAAELIEKIGGELLTLTKASNGVWTLSIMDTTYANSFDDMSTELLRQQLASLAPMMGGFKANVEISVPGLLETNMKKLGGGKVRYQVDFDREIAGREGSIPAFKALLSRKYVSFKGLK